MLVYEEWMDAIEEGLRRKRDKQEAGFT